ncbi:MAG: PAS domain-containing protein [Burkholderiales bacterium]|nr:PAS domain-containing protein [Burkholderiales bacterium]
MTPPPGTWAALLDASTDLLAVLDEAGALVWANAAFAQACQRPDSPLPGQPLAQALGLAPHEDPTLAMAEALRTQRPLSLPALAWQGADGSARSADASLAPLPAETPPGPARWLCRLRDTTALTQARAETARVAERLARAQEFGRLGLYERELPMGRGHWDAHMFRMWSINPADGAPDFNTFVRRIHPDDRPGLDYRDSARLAGKYAKRYRISAPNGQWRHVHAQWEVKNGPDGTPCQITGVMVDDTEVYELAESYNTTSAQLKLAVELGNIAIWRHELASNRIFYNDKGFEVLGLTPRPEGVPLEEVRALIHPDDMPMVLARADESLHAERPVDMEARYRRSDGSYRYLLTRRVVQRNADGEAIAFVGVALDVTEQVQETRRAQELAKRLEVAAAAAGLGVWSREPGRPRGEWNAQMFEMIGRPIAAGVPTRQEWLDTIIHPGDRERMRHAHTELRATEDTTVEHEYRILRPDGQVRWLVNRARHEKRDRGSVLFGITIDVTERVQTEAALRQANERIALAARGAGIGTWEHDIANDTAIWDEQMYVLRGLTPDCGRTPDELRFALTHPEDLKRARRIHAQAIKDLKPCTYEIRVRMPDGQYRWLASRSLPVCDEAGRVVRQIGVNWDVHERVTAEAERQEKLIAQRESQAKSEFLARMSHELRTPLNAVLGFAQLLQLDPALSGGDSRTKLRHILSAGEHLLSLINDVLDLSSLESGELKLDLQPVPLAEVLHEAMTLVETAARAAGVSLHAEPTPLLVQVDRIRMRQVLLNLLSNAVKYNRAQGQVHIKARAEGGRVVLSVNDTGRGMTRQQMAHLFEPFNRLGMEGEGIEGAGVGLAVVKALVERMGGTVQVESSAGVGSSFELRLPRGARSAADKAPTQPAAPAIAPLTPLTPLKPRTARQGRLLYIEDNPVNALLVEELVRLHAGLQIESVASGLGGLDRALALRPDLILVDMQLPDVNGFEVIRRLREQPATADIPCIALSANAMPEDIARAAAAGFSDYWTKPINMNSFLAALDRLFPN